MIGMLARALCVLLASTAILAGDTAGDPRKQALAQAIQAVPAQFKLNADGALDAYPHVRTLLTSLTVLIVENPDAAQNAAVGNVILAALDPIYDDAVSRRLIQMLGRTNPDLAGRAAAKFLEHDLLQALKSDGRPEAALSRLAALDVKVAAAARSTLRETFRKLFEAVPPADAGARGRCAMAWVFTGGAIEAAELEKIMGASPEPEVMIEWGKAIVTLQNTAGLRVILTVAQVSEKNRSAALTLFESLSGVTRLNRVFHGGVTELIAQDKAWLDGNEQTLIWSAADQHYLVPEPPKPAPAQNAVKPPAPPPEF